MTRASEIVRLALGQSGKPYVFGAEAPASDPDPDAHDCSELVEWACARAGVQPRVPDGSWMQLRHALKHGTTCSVSEALRTAGALLFRFRGDPLAGGRPSQAHVAISLGDGQTVEAKSRADGVGVFSARDRGWTHAARIPGVDYGAGAQPELVQVNIALPVLRLGDRGHHVALLQQALSYVANEQLSYVANEQLVVDGVLGQATASALERSGMGVPVDAVAWARLLGLRTL